LIGPGAAESYASAAFEQATSGRGWAGNPALVRLRARPAYRALDRYVLTPFGWPLLQFLQRRVTLALAGAFAMGVLAAAAPALTVFGVPLLSLSLTSLPVLGPLLVAAANGLPLAVGAAPLVGPWLAPVVAAAVQALLHDLVLGPMLNTAILTTLLTYPRAVLRELQSAFESRPDRRLSARDVAAAAWRAAKSGHFWGANAKTWLGMVTVGAEIEGIMRYAGQLDGLVDPLYSSLTRRHFTLFEDLGSAVERPAGRSVIPFGGAITWGNVLLYNVQNYLGFNLSDSVAHWLNPNAPAFHARDVVMAYSRRADQKDLPFDPDLYQRSPAQVEARLKELLSRSGDLEHETAAARAHATHIEARLAALDAREKELQAQSRPLTAAERAESEKLKAELLSKDAETYAKDKLAELHYLRE
jgi:hypothetical protein